MTGFIDTKYETNGLVGTNERSELECPRLAGLPRRGQRRLKGDETRRHAIMRTTELPASPT